MTVFTTLLNALSEYAYEMGAKHTDTHAQQNETNKNYVINRESRYTLEIWQKLTIELVGLTTNIVH